MKKITFLFYAILSILVLQNCANEISDKKINESPNLTEAIQIKNETPLLRHIVMFKFKEDALISDIKKVENTFRDLPNHIAEIKDFEWGTNNSPEELEQGFTHCFFVSFENEAGRAVYLPHPKHLEFVEILKPTLDKVLVFDYLAKK
ncbi:MAG: Dabb family protein [Saprospiraceae bacterium]